MKFFLKISLVLIFFGTVLTACDSKHENINDNQASSEEEIIDKIENKEKITFNDDIKPLFQVKCAICHNGSGLFDTQDFQAVSKKIAEIKTRVLVLQNMPAGGLPEAERELISVWLEEGALENNL